MTILWIAMTVTNFINMFVLCSVHYLYTLMDDDTCSFLSISYVAVLMLLFIENFVLEF